MWDRSVITHDTLLLLSSFLSSDHCTRSDTCSSEQFSWLFSPFSVDSVSRNVIILTGTLTGVPLVVSVDIYLDSQGFDADGKEINAICAPVWGHHEAAVHTSKFSSTCKCDFVLMVVVYIQSPTCLSGVVHILSHPWAAVLSCCVPSLLFKDPHASGKLS